jgi:hypothetical protein
LALHEVEKYVTAKPSKAPENQSQNNRFSSGRWRVKGAFKEKQRRSKTNTLPKQNINGLVFSLNCDL